MAGTRLDPRKQAALLNNHLSLENKVDINKIWPALAEAFTKDEQRDIQYGRDSREQMKRLVDLLPFKNDEAFDQLVAALRRDYRWLAARLEQSVRDENDRVDRAGRGGKDAGVRRKVALALLTTRISERQKDHVIDSMADVLEDELRDRSIKVSVYDNQALVDVNEIGAKLKKLINDHLDPIISGQGNKTDLRDEDTAAVVRKLQAMLEELEAIEDCYKALDVGDGPNTPRSMPVLLKQKIDETKTTIQILEQRNRQLTADKEKVEQQESRQDQTLMTIESKNRNLELENRTLETEVKNLQLDLTQLMEENSRLEKEVLRLDTDNIRLHGQVVGLENDADNVHTRIRRLDEANLRLTRENKKLSDAVKLLRQNARNRHDGRAAQLAAENKELAAEKLRLQTDIKRLDGEIGRLNIKNQRLQAENAQLHEQKRRLQEDKRHLSQQNKDLRQEARRLALGKYDKIQDLTPPDSKESPPRDTRLPPIRDSAREDDNDERDGRERPGETTSLYRSQYSSPQRGDPSPPLRREGARRSRRGYMPSSRVHEASPPRGSKERRPRRKAPTPTRYDAYPQRSSRNDPTPPRRGGSLSPPRNSQTSRRNDPTPSRRNGPSPSRRNEPTPSRRNEPTPSRRNEPSPSRRNDPTPSRRNDHTPSRRNEPSPSRRNDPTPSRRNEPSPSRRNDPSPSQRNTRQQQQGRKNDPSPSGRGSNPPGGRNPRETGKGGQPAKGGTSPRVPAATKTVSNPRGSQPGPQGTNKIWERQDARQKNAVALVKESQPARKTGAPPANSSQRVSDRLPPITTTNKANQAAGRTQNPAPKQEKTRPPMRN